MGWGFCLRGAIGAAYNRVHRRFCEYTDSNSNEERLGMCNQVVRIYAAAMVLCVGAAAANATAGEDLLVYWNFDNSAGAQVEDLSGGGLDGRVGAELTQSPAGKAAMMDGEAGSVVEVRLPQGKRFGRRSWTFMCMVKPMRLGIESTQNQRRIFAFGKYPDAYLVIDITGEGRLSCYFCYKDAAGKTVSTGGSSRVRLRQGLWTHIAVVCDRSEGEIRMYVNGYCPDGGRIADGFDGDFSLDGRLTVGSGWQNYYGLVDEVKIYRRAVGTKEIEAEFDRLDSMFEIEESAEVAAAKRRIRQERIFDEVNAAWSDRRFERVRELCRQVVRSEDAPEHFRSYAHLRIARSYLREHKRDSAAAVSAKIAENAAYPEVHRQAAAKLAGNETGIDSRTKVPEIAGFAAEVFVSPDGEDSNPGTKAKPFATLARARDEVRTIRKHGVRGAVAVTVMPGEYEVHNTLELATQDSGTDSGAMVYRAQEKGKAVFYGGRRLSGFEAVTDGDVLKRIPAEARTKVKQCNLEALGIRDYGELKVRGFGQPSSPPTLELFVDGEPMTLARWPNEGFVGIKKLVESGSKATGQPSVFEYVSDRHERWMDASDGWLFGYFHFLWADATIRIGKIDPEKNTVTTAEPYNYGGRGMSTGQGIQYYAFNLLEEIDLPGEWYLERETGMLYLYPPGDLDDSVVEIGMFSEPMIAMEGVSNVRIEGLKFDLGRYNGIVARNCSDCWFLGCSVGRMAGNGIMIHGGRDNRLIGCDVHTTGRRATEVIGGDRETLKPGGHVVENCRIYDFGRIDRTYTPAIQLEGVGNRVAHNLMYNGPSSAMRIEGNDHLMEFNEVHSMVRESDDQGAMELFGNPTYRGVVFRHNYYHNIGKTGSEKAVHGQAAVRFDDAISGMLVYGNVFYRCANGNFGAVQMNGGRDNVIDNNLFVDCKQGISGGWYRNNGIWRALREGRKPRGCIMNELYLQRYPQIVSMLREPGINHLWRNVFYRCGRVATRPVNIDKFQNAVFEDDPGFVDAANQDFDLRRDAELFERICFEPIPFDEIGLYESRWRASWPVETTAVRMPDWRGN